MTLSELEVFFLDLQTTGSTPASSDILEMAWSSSKSSDIESILVLPSTGFVPRRIQMITGITETEMTSAVDLPTAFGLLYTFLENLPQDPPPLGIIHFAQFEKPFLMQACEILKVELPFEILCTHQIAKRLMPNLPTRGIKGLAGYFGYNSGELKRSASHVEATRFIWKGLITALENEGIHTVEELQLWLQDKPATKRKKYEYPMAKEKRLSLPDQPGVYRMVSRWGEVLYVGKATSLHSRVNSYFRGQKNRDTRKLEMLTQVWDLQVTPCGSPLEAALLETDEIKRLNPRYNISLKTGGRAMVFFNHDFTSVSRQQDDVHDIGPFSNGMVLDSVRKLCEAVLSGNFSPLMFFDPIDPELIEAGFELFCDRHGFTRQQFSGVRNILAVGLKWIRQQRREDLETSDFTEANFSEVDDTDVSEAIDPEQVELTPEDLADKFERHFVRAAGAYLRSRQLTKLLNADIEFTTRESSSPATLKIRGGQILTANLVFPPSQTPWAGLNIDTYDRMSILTSELQKIRSQDGTVVIKICSKNPSA